jgi:predicted neuraminidase
MFVLLFCVSLICAEEIAPEDGQGRGNYRSAQIFPLVSEHVHGPTVVGLPNGDILAAWFQGSGERWADDVRIMGARLRSGAEEWSEPFLMADVPEFPDINPILFMDGKARLWLMWYTVIANQWETSLLKYRISEDYTGGGAPKWKWQNVLHVKPGDKAERGIKPDDRFVKSIERQIGEYAEYLSKNAGTLKGALTGAAKVKLWKAWGADLLAKARGEDMVRKGYLYDDEGKRIEKPLGYPYFRRMGWQTKNKAVVLKDGRIIVPLYSDGFSFSLMAMTDDLGRSWEFSEPLVGPGNIQPSIAVKSDGTLAAYMRDNGPAPKRLHFSISKDKGMTWGTVGDSELPNPGAGADIVMLGNGHWAIAYNDLEEGRHSLAISISTDEGKTWKYTRHLERDLRDRNLATRSHYPSIIQGRGGVLHVVYSHHYNDRKQAAHKTIKYARFDEAWVESK